VPGFLFPPLSETINDHWSYIIKLFSICSDNAMQTYLFSSMFDSNITAAKNEWTAQPLSVFRYRAAIKLRLHQLGLMFGLERSQIAKFGADKHRTVHTWKQSLTVNAQQRRANERRDVFLFCGSLAIGWTGDSWTLGQCCRLAVTWLRVCEHWGWSESLNIHERIVAEKTTSLDFRLPVSTWTSSTWSKEK